MELKFTGTGRVRVLFLTFDGYGAGMEFKFFGGYGGGGEFGTRADL